jgi:hypothetical protein
VVGAGNVIGATVLAWGWGAWHIYDGLVAPFPKIDLLRSLGWGGGIAATYAFFCLSYLLLHWWESRADFRRLQERWSAESAPAPGLRGEMAHGH